MSRGIPVLKDVSDSMPDGAIVAVVAGLREGKTCRELAESLDVPKRIMKHYLKANGYWGWHLKNRNNAIQRGYKQKLRAERAAERAVSCPTCGHMCSHCQEHKK